MAQGNAFKTYQRGRRQYNIDTNFSGGMMFTDGAVEANYVKTLVNYDIQNEGDTLIPRPGLRISELILPDLLSEISAESFEYHSSDNIRIVAAKECVEKGEPFRQVILGQHNTEGESKLYVLTTGEAAASTIDEENFSVDIALGEAFFEGSPCTYFSVPSSKIHGVSLGQEAQLATIIGTFAFGNSFYFINPNEGLSRTYLPEGSTKYAIEGVSPKMLDPSEAVTYGYNMLLNEDAYSFINTELEGNLQLTGILPYSTKKDNELLMTPRHNEDIYLRCHFKGQAGRQYKFQWEWRNVGDEDWNTLQSVEDSPVYTLVTLDDGSLGLNDGNEVLKVLQTAFKAPTTDILVRVQAFAVEDGSVSDTVEKAMTVGFDFSLEMYGTATNVKQETYDLKTATGMEFWQSRLVLWGVEKDPTVLFISDINDPSYFPYPNNISIYDEPIICVKPYLDSLLVFTTNAIHQVSLDDTGTGWNTTVVQSNLNIEPWDKHLIQIVRNMIFFKSGNYYYMMVPKAQDSTGKLTLAPVSNTIVDFFNHFEHNVATVLQDTFDYQGTFELINYYNFLDYEDVHNIYVYRYADDNYSGYFHFDILYNTVTRAWRVHTYEAPHFLYPFKQDATQRGVLASTAILDIEFEEGTKGVRSVTKDVSKVLEHTVDTLYISDVSVDFYDHRTLIVEVQDKNGIEYFKDTFKVSTLEDTSLKYVNKNGAALVTSLTEDDKGLQLVGATFKGGSVVTIYDEEHTTVLCNPTICTPVISNKYLYKFPAGTITDDTIIEISGTQYYLEGLQCEAFSIEETTEGYVFLFNEEVLEPPRISTVNYSEIGGISSGRCIQLYKYDSLDMQDLSIPAGVLLKLRSEGEDNVYGYNIPEMVEAIKKVLTEAEDSLRFNNWQFVDTGYRNFTLELNKRYRELQFQLNNIEGKNLEFGLEFLIDGDRRTTFYTYDVEYVTDVESDDYGLLYVTPTPVMNLSAITSLNSWSLEQSNFPEVSLWKVRTPVSGKGQAPRIRLLGKNISRYELMSINWVYRMMNAR